MKASLRALVRHCGTESFCNIMLKKSIWLTSFLPDKTAFWNDCNTSTLSSRYPAITPACSLHHTFTLAQHHPLTFIPACFVVYQNSSYLQWACFSNVLLSVLCLDGVLVLFHWFQWAFDSYLLIDTALHIQLFLSSVGILCKNMYS